MATPSSILDLFPSFTSGFRLVDGGELQTLVNLLFSTKYGIVALSGGGQVGATPLQARYNRVDTVAVNDDSVMLPDAIPGSYVTVHNNTAQTLAVFGVPLNPLTGVGDVIAATGSNVLQPTATGVTQATANVSTYSCVQAGVWKQN